jgi:hypothetical protein
MFLQWAYHQQTVVEPIMWHVVPSEPKMVFPITVDVEPFELIIVLPMM